jgi:structural maintenance of chromosome 2
LQSKYDSLNINYDNNLSELQIKKNNVIKTLDSYKEEKMSNKITLLDSTKTSFLERLETIGNIEEKIKRYKFVSDQVKKLTNFSEDKKNKVKDKIKEIEEQISEIKLKNSEYSTEKKILQKELNQLNSNPLKGKTKCPTCGQEIDTKSLNEHITDIQRKIDLIQLIDYTDQTNELNKYNKMLTLIEDKLTQKNEFEKELLSLSSIDKESKEITEINDKLTQINIDIEVENKHLKEIDSKIKEVNCEISVIEEDIKEIENKIKEFQSVEKQLVQKKNEYQLKKQERDSLIDKQNKLSSDIKDIKLSIENDKNEEIKYIEELEYMKYLKTVLKDDNVKKYAISNIIPYINKFSNEYLSEVGFNFYVVIDN